MAIRHIVESTVKRLTCLSTDTKPTTKLTLGSTIIEEDTGNEDQWGESGWFPKGVSVLANDGNLVSVQNPFPVNGDRVYSKDIDLDNSDIGDFSGEIADLFNSRTSTITTSEDNPSLIVALQSPIHNQEITLLTASGSFRNVTAVVKSAAGTTLDTDDSIAGDATPRTEYTLVFPSAEKWCVLELSFATTEDVTIGFAYTPKAIHVQSHGHAFKPNGTLVALGATANGNQKFGLEEWDETLLDNPLPVHVIDVHTILINEHFRNDSGTSEVLTAPASAGDSTVTVADGATYSVNDRVTLDDPDGDHETDVNKIISISTNDLTLDKPIENNLASGTVVEITDIGLHNATGTIVSPDVFKIAPPAGEVWHIGRIIIAIADEVAMDDGKFGGISALTNGVVLRIENGDVKNGSVWRTNGDMAEDMYDITYTDKAPAGENGLRGRWSFNKVGVSFKLDGDLGHFMALICQDTLTGLTEFEVKAQGHTVGA